MSNYFDIDPAAFERGTNDENTAKEYQMCVDELITIELETIGISSDYILNLLNTRKEKIVARIQTMFSWHEYTSEEMSNIYYEYSNNQENFEH